MRRLKANKEM